MCIRDRLDAVNTPSVYGGLAGVKLGLKMIEEGVMQSASADSMEVLRYVMTIMQLQKQLHSDPSKFQEFGADVERLSAFEEDILAQECSKVYQTYIFNHAATSDSSRRRVTSTKRRYSA